VNAERFRRIDEIFNHARSLETEDRSAYLSAACGEDRELIVEVEALLSHDGEPEAIFKTPAMNAGIEFSQDDGQPAPAGSNDKMKSAEMIGGYRIERVIGEGGFGVVYLAMQERPRRVVALKVIRGGVATPQMLKRFEYEAQVLGRLTHPGIAQVYEAGTEETSHGTRAFFAMEYVKGKRLDHYVNDNKLDVKARLSLIAAVCDAVQYAHQQGIIHRDLKPANILVDEHGNPKILDFGVSRATDRDIYTTTLQTSSGQLIGTLPYMSPEQVSGNPAEVDTRSDVYAIGVILYQLLTGKLPHDLASRSIPDAARVIRDEQPTRLSSVSRAFRGDVDTIVLKAMEKDKDRRYQSAADLGADIRRYLAGEPIEAKRNSGWYVLQKTLRRYKLVAAFSALLVILLIASTIVFAVLYQRADREMKRAQEQERRADLEMKHARQEERRATVVKEFIERVFQTADIRSSRGEDRTVREAIDRVADSLETSFKDEPAVEASIRNTIGQTYQSLGLSEKAEPHFRRTLDIQRELSTEPTVDYALALEQYGIFVSHANDFERAEPMLREALEILENLLPPDHPDTGHVLRNLGLLLMHQNKMEGVEEMLIRGVEIARNAPPEIGPRASEQSELVDALNGLVQVFQATGRLDEAEKYAREAMDLCRERLGEDHPMMAPIVNNLGTIYGKRDKLREALPMYEKALELVRASSGEKHPDVAHALANVGITQIRLGHPREGERHYREAHEILSTVLPEGHAAFASILTGLGRAILEQGRASEAEPYLRNADDIRRKTARPGDYLIGYTGSVLGRCLVELKKHAEAEALLLEAYELIVKAKGPAFETAVTTAKALAALYEARGNSAEAAKWRERAPA